MKWIQKRVDTLEVFNVFQSNSQVYVIHRRPIVNNSGLVVLQVLNIETGAGGTQRWMPDSLVEVVMHQS